MTTPRVVLLFSPSREKKSLRGHERWRSLSNSGHRKGRKFHSINAAAAAAATAAAACQTNGRRKQAASSACLDICRRQCERIFRGSSSEIRFIAVIQIPRGIYKEDKGVAGRLGVRRSKQQQQQWLRWHGCDTSLPIRPLVACRAP
jgi:hypothetical protein